MKLHQIVRLRQIVKKWHRFASKNGSFTSIDGCKWRRRGFRSLDDEEKSYESSSSIPPRGYLAVYVGKERKRYMIRTCYLNHPLFRALLKKVEEEFGFHHKGGLTIPCEVVVFDRLLSLLVKKDMAALQDVELRHHLCDFYNRDGKDDAKTCCIPTDWPSPVSCC